MPKPPARTKAKSPPAKASQPYQLPDALQDILAPTRLIRGEDVDAYDLLRYQLTKAIHPTDFVEWMWVSDLTDLIWEERRAKHARAVRLKLAKRQAIELLLRAVYPRNGEGHPQFEFELEQDVSDIFLGVQVPQEGFRQLCQKLGITNLDLFGLVYQAAAEDLDRLQKMGDRAASRRNLILREIDRRRDATARRTRETIKVVLEAQDAEFE